MSQASSFFVPKVPIEEQEKAFAELASFANQPVPRPVERVYSITYIHDGEEWTATVGESLRGIRRRTVRSKNNRVERVNHVSDPAMVLAIFPGVPYVVVTNYRFDSNVRSVWENPFYSGKPNFVTCFST